MTTASLLEAKPDEGLVPEWDLADRMTKSLRERNISVGAMAEAFGISRATVGRWLSGRFAPSKAQLFYWSTLTGVDLHWLETGCAIRDSNPEPAALVETRPDLRVLDGGLGVKPGLTLKLSSPIGRIRGLRSVS